MTHFLSRQLLQDEEEEVKSIDNRLSSHLSNKNKINKTMDSSISTSWYTDNNSNSNNNKSNNSKNNRAWSSTSTSSHFSFQKEQQPSLLFGFPSSISPIYNNNNNNKNNDHDNNNDSILVTHQEENDKENRWDRFEPYVDESEFDPTIRPTTTTSTLILNDPSLSSSLIHPNHHQEEEEEEQQQQSIQKEKEKENEESTIGKVLDNLISIFPNNDKTELLEKLKSFDYDLEKTVEYIILSSVKSSSSSEVNKNRNNDNNNIMENNNYSNALTQSRSTTPIHQHDHHSTIVMTKSPIVSSTVSPSPSSPSKKRQVCRHYLAGECYRKDCWFAHDLDIKPCKFW